MPSAEDGGFQPSDGHQRGESSTSVPRNWQWCISFWRVRSVTCRAVRFQMDSKVAVHYISWQRLSLLITLQQIVEHGLPGGLFVHTHIFGNVGVCGQTPCPGECSPVEQSLLPRMFELLAVSNEGLLKIDLFVNPASVKFSLPHQTAQDASGWTRHLFSWVE